MHENRRQTNFAAGVVEDAGGITAVATTFTSSALARLPVIAAPDIAVLVFNPDQAYPAVPETVWVTAHASGANTATILRGQESTASQSQGVNTIWRHVRTRTDGYSAWKDKIIAPGLRSDVAAAVLDDEFNDGTLDSAWTRVVPSGTMTVTEGNDSCSILVHNNAGLAACCVLKPLGSFAIGNSIETALRTLTIQSYIMAGPIITNGTAVGSTCVWQMPYWFVDATNLSLRSGTINNVATTLWGQQPGGEGRGWIFLRLKWVAANSWQAFWSPDGVSWTDFGAGAFSVTMTPTYIGLAASTWGGANDSIASFEYFRVV